jgi:hypothetical protein
MSGKALQSEPQRVCINPDCRTVYSPKLRAQGCCSRSCAAVMRHRLVDVVTRFWSKVNKNGPTPHHCPELGPCWIWTAGLGGSKVKYGSFSVGGRTIKAHRFSYELEFGPALNLICHRCDNPLCVRPSHLFDGTPLDNEADKIAKGRRPVIPGVRGAQNVNARLTAGQVQEIRRLYGSTSTRELGRRYGVTHTTIILAARGKRYVEVAA